MILKTNTCSYMSNVKYKLIILLIVTTSVIFIACPAFAVNPLEEAGIAGENGVLSVFYKFTRAVGIPFAALGLAMCFMGFFMSNEKGVAVLKKSMMYIGIALAVLMLIPNIYGVFSTGTLRNMAWNPEDNNRMVIIANSDTRNKKLSELELTVPSAQKIEQSWGANEDGELPNQNTFFGGGF